MRWLRNMRWPRALRRWLGTIGQLDVQELGAIGLLSAGLWSLYDWNVAAVVAGSILLVESLLARLRTRQVKTNSATGEHEQGS